jgi:hypothetical protein
MAVKVNIRGHTFVLELCERNVDAHLLFVIPYEYVRIYSMVAGRGGADEGAGLEGPAVVGSGFVYVVPGCEDVVTVADVVNREFDVMGVASGSIRGDKLPAVAVVVRDGAVEDDKALWSRVVLTELSKVQVGVKGVSFRRRGTGVDYDWLRGRRRRPRQGRRSLRWLWGSGAQTVT